MRFSPISLALTASSLVAAQQYAGDVIPGTLPATTNAEVAFWKIRDPTGANANLTLINYASLNNAGQRPDNSKIQRAVLSIHGLLRDPWNYENDVRYRRLNASVDLPY
jgi:hypothetical protein